MAFGNSPRFFPSDLHPSEDQYQVKSIVEDQRVGHDVLAVVIWALSLSQGQLG